ncbi:MAG: Taurine catabolism dioxygenase TauD [Gammaproteobacteria bacterium]|jgi:alpha-ketoglutarate-dependent taurine dioxygenase|nr:Taurine catabolism dioxygenase TauD [Gammaproteobacteria bacterium]HEV7443117.1 TauD/TfdA family dioxygenase [Steroidobacteraceae bacterium]
MSTARIEPIKPHMGGIVHVAKEHLLEDQTIAAVREALEDRGVLVFPRMNLTDAEQLSFTDKLGKRVNYNRKAPGRGDDEDVYAITLDKKVNTQPEYVLGTFFWHIDGVTIDQPLPKATLLTARKLSPTGGQTEFASMYAAYENLPETEKQALEGVKVVHRMEASMRPVFDQIPEEDLARWRAMSAVMTHPLVWTHNSGRKSLLVGSHADSVVGRPIPHGRSLLVRLLEWAGQPAFSYRHEWQEGDLVIWDNCGCMHRVVPYDENSGRRMHRTTIMGEERVAGSARHG